MTYLSSRLSDIFFPQFLHAKLLALLIYSSIKSASKMSCAPPHTHYRLSVHKGDNDTTPRFDPHLHSCLAPHLSFFLRAIFSAFFFVLSPLRSQFRYSTTIIALSFTLDYINDSGNALLGKSQTTMARPIPEMTKM